jgi:hypothetical protein
VLYEFGRRGMQAHSLVASVAQQTTSCGDLYSSTDAAFCPQRF